MTLAENDVRDARTCKTPVEDLPQAGLLEVCREKVGREQLIDDVVGL